MSEGSVPPPDKGDENNNDDQMDTSAAPVVADGGVCVTAPDGAEIESVDKTTDAVPGVPGAMASIPAIESSAGGVVDTAPENDRGGS